MSTSETPNDKLSAQERAEKFCQTIKNGVNDHVYFHLKKWLAAELESYAAERSRKAVEEALEWKVKEMVSEPGMMIHWQKGVDYGKAEAFAEGKRAAYEDAGRIVEGYGGPCNGLAQQIRARAKELESEGRKSL